MAGFLALAIYFYVLGHSAQAALGIFFNFSRSWRLHLLGAFFSLSTMGWLSGVAIIFYKLSASIIVIIFALNVILWWAAAWWARRSEKDGGGARRIDEAVASDGELGMGKRAWWLVLVYVFLTVYGFFLLYRSRTGEAILTPWQTIHHTYIYIFAGATLVLGIIIFFSKLRASLILLLLITHSVLLHSYLPLTHRIIYGADQWRHIANEQRIIQERPLNKAVVSSVTARGGNVSFGDLAYSQLWGITVIISRVTGMDLIFLNAWLVPIIWSVLLPVLLFEFCSILSWNKKYSLLLVWFSFLPFAWQVGGSFTLPVNFGFLLWLFLMLLLSRRLLSSRREQIFILVGLGIFSVLSYSLYAILFWLAWGMSEILQFKTKSLKLGVIIAVGSLVIPGLELATRYSSLPSAVNVWRPLKQLVGNFTAFYLASGPRLHDITTGNIIFNQAPRYAFVANFFTLWRWWLVVFMVLFWAIVAIGWVYVWKKRTPLEQWIAVMSISLMVSYVLSRYVLAGENIMARRLDIVLAFFFLVLAILGIRRLGVFIVRCYRSRAIFSYLLVSASLIVLTIAIAASYSLGPDTNAVSADEYRAMRYVWEQEKSFPSRYCVIADTYPLLALEAISARAIVGGGFPINKYFAQPELIDMVERARERDVSIADRREALRITQAPYCWYVGLNNQINGSEAVWARQFGKVTVRRYN